MMEMQFAGRRVFLRVGEGCRAEYMVQKMTISQEELYAVGHNGCHSRPFKVRAHHETQQRRVFLGCLF